MKIEIKKKELFFFKDSYIDIEETSESYKLEFPYNRPEFLLTNIQKIMTKKFYSKKISYVDQEKNKKFEKKYHISIEKEYFDNLKKFMDYFSNNYQIKKNQKEIHIKWKVICSEVNIFFYLDYYLSKISKKYEEFGKIKVFKKNLEIEISKIERILGNKINFKDLEEIESIKIKKKNDNNLLIEISDSRIDILNYEDIAMEIFSKFLKKIKPEKFEFTQTIGKKNENFEFYRKLMLQYNFKEKKNFTLENIKNLEKYSKRELIFEISNPIVENMNCIRNKLFPKLIEIREKNIFEFGIIIKKKTEKIIDCLAIKTQNYGKLNKIINILLEKFPLQIKENKKEYFQKNYSMNIILDENKIGEMGKLLNKEEYILEIELNQITCNY